jgi:predicted Zn-dependent protease
VVAKEKEIKVDLRQGAELFAAGRYDQASKHLENLLSEGSDTPGLRHLLAESLVMCNQEDKAVEHLRKAVPRSGDVPTSFYEVLKKILSRCEKPEASEAWKLAGEVSSRASDRNLILGALAVELGHGELS